MADAAPTGDAQANAPGGPIFAIGSLGSGSTLLRLMLDSHANIAIPQETGFMRAVLANEWIPFWRFGGEWHTRLGLDDDELRARLAAFYGGLFHDFAARAGKPRWGDKTPFHVWHVAELCRLFPDAVFLGIVRHPGGVVASLHNRFGYDWGKATRHWARVNRRLVYEGSRLGDRFVLCRYEGLVRDPEPVMRELLRRIGEPWDPAVLAHHEVQQARGGPVEVDGHTRADRPLDSSRAGAWRAELDDEAWRLLRGGTVPPVPVVPVARYFGYDLDDPERLDPIAEAASPWVVSGTELARRCAAHPGVDWSDPPQPGLENRLLTPELLQRLPDRPLPAAAHRLGVEELGRRLARRLPEPARRPLRRLARRVRGV